jgi:hypothetical protein
VARTVYDYSNSGTFIDGTGSEKGTFPQQIASVAYSDSSENFFVGVTRQGNNFESPPGYLSKFSKAGTPALFGAVGVDTLIGELGEPEPVKFPIVGARNLAVDNTGGATDGDIYVEAGTTVYRFGPNGEQLPGWPRYFGNQSCGISVDPEGDVWVNALSGFDSHVELEEFTASGVKTGQKVELGRLTPGLGRDFTACGATFDNDGNFYMSYKLKNGSHPWLPTKWKLGNEPQEEIIQGGAEISAGAEEFYQVSQANTTSFKIDRSNNDVFVNEGGHMIAYYDDEGRRLGAFEYTGTAVGMEVDPATHDVWLANSADSGGGVRRVEKYARSAPITVPTTDTDTPDLTGSTATLKGTINADGIATTDCHFEWGPTQALGSIAPCAEGSLFEGSGDHAVTANLTGLNKGTSYWYRLKAKNANEHISDGGPVQFFPQEPPVVSSETVSQVSTDGAVFHASVDPNGGYTRFHVEWGLTESYGNVTEESSPKFGTTASKDVKQVIGGVLQPNSTYHYRIVATNESGPGYGEDRTFITYDKDATSDPCGNALVRQQTSASLLLDCRSYELVSARNTGGYDVESDLIPGQTPLISPDRAQDRFLYSIHAGSIPGVSGNPTNFGRDPYVAARGEDGWSTRYVGLPANGMAQKGAFGSPLFGTDQGLTEFAFGGGSICNPCFKDGPTETTNIPLRLSNGELVKGMAGSLDPGSEANPSQAIGKAFSADGSHFVFGSNGQFEELGSAEGSIYDRDLAGGATQVVSTTPGGTAINGGNLAELDISSDGSRIVIGQKVGSDSAGNSLYHLYMHIGTSPNSVDLTPGATSGVLFDGMDENGTRVFFTAIDNLLADTDTSADIFETAVDNGGTPTSRIVSTNGGAVSNDDSCTPPGDPDQWNAGTGEGKCGAVAFAGGAGVADEDGTFYFVSPELLSGAEGEANEPNLYIVKPGGSPEFVRTIDSSAAKPGPPPPNHPLVNEAGLITGLSTPEALTVDQDTGDIYVVERGASRVSRYDSTGAPHNFTAGFYAGTNQMTELFLGAAGRAQVGIDNAAASPMHGDIYVKYFPELIAIFESSGELAGLLEGFGEVCGIAVDGTTGDVYVGDRLAGTIWRFAPISGGGFIENSNYTKTGLKTSGISPCHVAVDGAGHVYASGATTGPLQSFNVSDFAAVPATIVGTTVQSTSRAMAVDPANDQLYANSGGAISRYNSSLGLIQEFGLGLFSGSRGVAINKGTKHVYVTNGSTVLELGIEKVPYVPIDHPGVVHGVHQAGVRSFEDFQVTSNGKYAMFTSVLPLEPAYTNAGHAEVYRYDASTNTLSCASCAPSNAAASTDAFMPKFGRGITEDGRAFFNTDDSLVLRDTNEIRDAYEWKAGEVQLISSGTSEEDSKLLAVSPDGRDAFFFTRETLAREDENGSTVKIYDARENGGYLYDRPPFLCAASDECHGAGTQPPPAPNINTQVPKPPSKVGGKHKCPKNKVRRKGKCVKRHRKTHRRNKGHKRHSRTGRHG